MDIKFDHVYSNEHGEERLAVSINRNATTKNHVVIWRTAACPLAKGVKSQGSSTLANFAKWPTSVRKATKDDWDAFSIVEAMRKDFSLAKQRIKKRNSNWSDLM